MIQPQQFGPLTDKGRKIIAEVVAEEFALFARRLQRDFGNSAGSAYYASAHSHDPRTDLIIAHHYAPAC